MGIINYMDQSDYSLIGTIKKTKNSSDYWELFLEETIEELPSFKEIFILLHHTYVPFTVKTWEENNGKVQLRLQDDSIVVQDSLTERKKVFLPYKMMEPHLAKSPFALLNYTVYDTKQEKPLGQVVEIIPRFQQPILCIEGKEEIMIPFHEAIVTTINHDKKTLQVTLPPHYLTSIKESN